MKAKETIRIIEQDGWKLSRQKGGHMQFEHPTKPGITTVPFHGSKDLSRGDIARFLRQSGLK